MRNFVPSRNNLYKLPHDTYMQIFYILRDYSRIKKETGSSSVKKKIIDAIENTSEYLAENYKKRSSTYGELDAMHAFFDYPYYSYMFSRKYAEVGASKNAWGLFRSKFAYLVADKLGLL